MFNGSDVDVSMAGLGPPALPGAFIQGPITALGLDRKTTSEPLLSLQLCK